MAQVVVEDHGRARVVRINRPEAANALSSVVMTDIGNVLQAAETDDAVRCIVITGAGDRVFSSGMDLREFVQTSRQVAPTSGPGLGIFLNRVYAKPIIAAVNGAAVAGGFEIVLAADLVVAATHATFGLPQVRRGLVAGANGLSLARRIPRVRAMEIALTGDPIGAAEALAVGLVNRVVPAAQVLDEALRFASALERSAPNALAVTKRAMLASPALAPEIVAELEETFGGDEAREGAKAFIDGRAPAWAPPSELARR